MGNRCHAIIVGSYSQGSPLKGSSSILPIFSSISIFLTLDLLYHPEVGYLVELSSDAQKVKEYLPKRHPIPNTSSAAATAGQPVPIGFHTGTTCTSVGIMFQERSIEGEGLGLVQHIHMANAVSLMQVRGAAIKRGVRGGALVQ